MSIYNEVDSTNSEALRFAENEDPGNHWFLTKEQTHGRGRYRHHWESHPGNLCTSLLLRLECCCLTTATQLSLVAGLAAYDALLALCGKAIEQKICLKWPNDILLDHAKVGGVLLESKTIISRNGEKQLYVVIGTGLNLAWHPVLLERHTTDLSAHDFTVSIFDALTELGKATTEHLALWQNGKGFANVRDLWLARSQPVGSSIHVHVGDVILKGVYSGINDQGGLILTRADGKILNIHAGDVTFHTDDKQQMKGGKV